jgi:hypothetical protein
MQILRCLRGTWLGCGCLVGIYETYSSEILAILDSKGDMCRDGSHQPNVIVDRRSAGTPKATERSAVCLER